MKAVTIGDLKDVFEDISYEDPEKVVYTVSNMNAGKNVGELLYGITAINAGNVNAEYFMTRGHFHEKMENAEVYFCISGNGYLLLKDESGKEWIEKFFRGSICYVPPRTAHRVINTDKSEKLVFLCVCGSDSGHDYSVNFEKRFHVI